jgi:hypothetical protein
MNIIRRKRKPCTLADSCQQYVGLYLELVRDVAEQFAISRKESRRDVEEIQHRVRDEGFAFLTKSLPRLGKHFDKALSQGDKFAPVGFDKKPTTTIPKFLWWLFELVFDSSGLEKPDSDSRAVLAIRQLVYFVYKLEVPHELEQERKLLSDFAEVDSALPEVIQEDEELRHARNLVTSIFGTFDIYDIKPKHGPGAVATGELNHTKHVFKRLYDKIEAVYPFTEYFVYSLAHVADQPRYVTSLEKLESGTAKVVLVPKDSRGPRIISCEPLEYQWIQQGLGNAIRDHLEKHRLTKGNVNFTYQDVNRNLALRGSIDQQWVTLDMKEASDRVSIGLVEALCRDNPELLKALMACRSTRTVLPNGSVVTMKKFAPMGSNLCFPVLSLVSWVLAVSCVVAERLRNRPSVSRRYAHLHYCATVRWAAKRVFVYGDDIIMKREDYALALQYFPKVGLMFNRDKCCTAGFFRESCGMDAHKGVCVTPLRLKKLWCHRRVDPAVISSYVAFSNAAYSKGYHRTAAYVARLVEQKVGTIPVLPDRYRPSDMDPDTNLPYGGWAWIRFGSCVRDNPPKVKIRFNTDLHRLEVLTRQAGTRYINVFPDDWCMVLRRFTTPSERSEPGVFALTRSKICKRVWIPVAQ